MDSGRSEYWELNLRLSVTKVWGFLIGFLETKSSESESSRSFSRSSSSRFLMSALALVSFWEMTGLVRPTSASSSFRSSMSIMRALFRLNLSVINIYLDPFDIELLPVI